MSRLDPITLEILNTEVAAAAEEMALTLRRTARSLYVKEAVDFGVGLTTPEGRFFGNPRQYGNALIDYDIAPTLQALGEPLEEGDVLFTNHPYETAGLVSHTPDLTLICPYFADGRLIAYGYTFVHSTDIGGKVPSSVSPTNTELFQEGLLIPPVKLIRGGTWNKEILRLYKANVRTPEVNGHDLTAMLAALNTGAERVAAMVAHHGADAFLEGQRALMDYAAQKARDVLRTIPDGTYDFADFLDDDAITPIPMRFTVAMTVTDGAIHLDFTDTDPQVESAYNVPTLGRRHAWLTVRILHFVTTHDPSVPMNGGIFRDVTVALKKGTILDPQFPAPVGVRAASAYRLNDAVTGAFAKAVPREVPCPSGGAMVPVVLAEFDKVTGARNVLVLNSIIVGSGARYGSDGYDGVDGSLSTIRNTPAEKSELEAGVDILEYGLNRDSAGAGEWRGGLGLRFTFRVTQGGSAVLGRGLERFYFRPWGMAGGLPGVNMRVVRNIGTPAQEELGKIDMVPLEEGDTVTFLTPGGGGYGDPFCRPPEAVLADVLAGFVSTDAARRDYGVAIDHGTVDAAATATLRAARPLRTGSDHAFDFGPERAVWDSVFTPERMGRLNAAVMAEPTALRPAKRKGLFAAAIPALFDPAAKAARDVLGDPAGAASAIDAALTREKPH
ncbi:MAG: hydantoinase B/oxoprolinase family protein [Pseudomonadota bacterium]